MQAIKRVIWPFSHQKAGCRKHTSPKQKLVNPPHLRENAREDREERKAIVANLTVDLPDELLEALGARARLRGNRPEAEVLTIIEDHVLPEIRLGLESLLTAVGQRVQPIDEESPEFTRRDQTSVEPTEFK